MRGCGKWATGGSDWFWKEALEGRTNHLWLGAYLATAKPLLHPMLFQQTARSGKFLSGWLRRERPDAVLTIHSDWHRRLARAGVATAYLNDIEPYPGAPHIRLDARAYRPRKRASDTSTPASAGTRASRAAEDDSFAGGVGLHGLATLEPLGPRD